MAKQSHALVIGVSDYKPPFNKLTGVANDVREMAGVLRTKPAVFAGSDVVELLDSAATKDAILAALKNVLTVDADTVFVYLAGHGAAEGDDYYFIPHDVTATKLSSTAVSLREIKELFDKSPSDRVFLWLDSCHSGGIVKRAGGAGEPAAEAPPVELVKRAIKVVSGSGRVIICACTKDQYAYENPHGHGLFTDALLRGLKGDAKNSVGEVTVLSLHDFIDHDMGSDVQRPVLFGELTGRIVLMHFEPRTIVAIPVAEPSMDWFDDTGNTILLGDNYFKAQDVRTVAGTVEVAVATYSAADDAAMRDFDPSARFGKREYPFAYRTDGMNVTVKSISSEATPGGLLWKMVLEPQPISGGMDITYQEGGRTWKPEDIGELRARYLLLNETPPISRGASPISLVETEVLRAHGTELSCVVTEVFGIDAPMEDKRAYARLLAVYVLKTTRTVREILDLAFGPVVDGKMAVRFKGRRKKQYDNVPAAIIEFEGECKVG